MEYLWSHWKQHELPNFCPKTFGQLSTMPAAPCAACAAVRLWSAPSGNRRNSFHCNYIMQSSIGEGWFKHLRRYLSRFSGCRNAEHSEQVLGCFLLAAESMHR